MWLNTLNYTKDQRRKFIPYNYFLYNGFLSKY